MPLAQPLIEKALRGYTNKTHLRGFQILRVRVGAISNRLVYLLFVKVFYIASGPWYDSKVLLSAEGSSC